MGSSLPGVGSHTVDDNCFRISVLAMVSQVGRLEEGRGSDLGNEVSLGDAAVTE